MQIRPLHTSDLPQCLTLLKRVWDFSGFAHPQAEDATAAWYLQHHLQPSTDTFVVEFDGKVAGYLFATVPGVPPMRTNPPWKTIGDDVEVAWEAVTTPDERQGFKDDWFYGGNWIERALLDQGIASQDATWVQLFVVNPDVQGQGLGSRLWKAFESIKAARAANEWTLLKTDTWCSWRFYERRGLTRIADCVVKELPPEDDGTQPAYFLYGLAPKDRPIKKD